MRPMHSNAHPVWAARISTFVLAAALAGSVVFWSLKMSAPAAGTAVLAVDSAPSLQIDSAAVARALGSSGAEGHAVAAIAVAASSRFVLTGVVAGRSQHGTALIAVDGRPPKPFVVGARVVDDWGLCSVQPRRAVLVRTGTAENATAASDSELVLELPVEPLAKGKNGL